MAAWDNNGNGSIDYNDGFAPEDVDAVNEMCDYNGDGQTSACELHECVVAYENQIRAEHCPGYPMAQCACPFEGVAECAGAWTCDEIYQITVDTMNEADTNGDGTISTEDGWSQEDIDNINYYCDYNGSGATDACELHACVVDYNN